MSDYTMLRGCGCSYASIYCKPWDLAYYCGLSPIYAAHLAEENRTAMQHL